MPEHPTRVTASVDYEAPGKQFGVLNVPYSHDQSAWGAVRVPVVVASNGQGPTLLLVGGNHGDEYEGPIALMKLARALEPAEIRGRVIMLPALNLPAVLAGTRVSPLDQVNMNRAFPGDPLGTPTLMIADYVARHVLPRCDVVLDLHSGGKTLAFVPFIGMHALPDRDLMARTRAALMAFGAPVSLVIEEFDVTGMLDTMVERAGKVFLFTELGGGGSASAATVAIAERGIASLMRHLGMAEGGTEATASRLMHSPDASFFVVADDHGMLEMLADLGQEIDAGQPVAQIHAIEKPRQPPVVYRAQQSGLLLGRHWPGLIRPGDCLAVIGRDYAQPAI